MGQPGSQRHHASPKGSCYEKLCIRKEMRSLKI